MTTSRQCFRKNETEVGVYEVQQSDTDNLTINGSFSDIEAVYRGHKHLYCTVNHAWYTYRVLDCVSMIWDL